MDSNTVMTGIESDMPQIVSELSDWFGDNVFTLQPTADGIPTLWVSREKIRDIIAFLKKEARPNYALLFDLTAMDERLRTHRQGLPDSDFTVVYHLLSFGRNQDIRIKAALSEANLSLPSICEYGLPLIGTRGKFGTCSA